MTDPREHRQLLAIMFTDVVGYTALTERDEAAAVRVRTQHRDLVRTLVEQFDGELIDSTGDESLSIFPSALRALVVHGRDDQPVPIEAGRALASFIPNVRFEVVEGGHLEGTGGTPGVRERIIGFFDEGSGAPAPGSPE